VQAYVQVATIAEIRRAGVFQVVLGDLFSSPWDGCNDYAQPRGASAASRRRTTPPSHADLHSLEGPERGVLQAIRQPVVIVGQSLASITAG